jgi:hypothetical protein
MSSRLIALKVRRRSVATAVFSGKNLDYAVMLHLSDDPEAATGAAARFLARTLEDLKPTSAALGIGQTSPGERVANLHALIETMLAPEGIPITRVEDKVLLESYAVPKLKNKDALRPIVASFWPHLGARQLAAFEAVALGFHMQTEHLLSQSLNITPP